MTPVGGMVAPRGSKRSLPVRNRIYRAVVIWADGDVEDADEITVLAQSEDEARREARKKWRLTVGAKWPKCVVSEILISNMSNTPKTPCAAPPH